MRDHFDFVGMRRWVELGDRSRIFVALGIKHPDEPKAYHRIFIMKDGKVVFDLYFDDSGKLIKDGLDETHNHRE